MMPLRALGTCLSCAMLYLLLLTSVPLAPSALSKAAAVPYLEGESYRAEWLEEGPSVRLFPKSQKSGEVIREEFFGLDVLGFQEKVLCYCCRETTLGFHVVNCHDYAKEGLGPFVDFRNVTWKLEVHEPGKNLSWTTSDFWERHNGNTTRTLNFKKGGVKFTISFDNYSPLLFNITEEPDRYFGITTLNRFLLSRPVTNTSELGVFNLDDVPSAYQIPLAIRTKDEPILKASFALTMFSLQDPPSASRELLHPPEWGFENVDAVQRDLYYVNGEIHGQYIELIFAGARSVFYDPDLSILLGSSEEEQAEEGRDADDGEDVTLPVALSITAVAVIAILAVLGGFMWRRYYRRCRRSVAAESSVNF
ncbi:hypothetical protein QOT17_006253 [Balamuthia mandrillaris]